MWVISKSEYDQFEKKIKNRKPTSVRWGQLFYTHFKLDRLTKDEDHRFANQIYYALDEISAKRLAMQRIDFTQ